MTSTDLSDFEEPIRALQNLVEKFNNQGVIIGGIAASILGQPRLTNDVDAVLLLSIDDLDNFIETASSEEIIPRMEDAAAFARKNRILLMQHEPSQTPIDISLGILPFEREMVERSALILIDDDLELRLPTPEDLIIMKAIAHRAKDLEDIRSIVSKQTSLDVPRIESWVTAFAEALEMPEIWTDIQDFFS